MQQGGARTFRHKSWEKEKQKVENQEPKWGVRLKRTTEEKWKQVAWLQSYIYSGNQSNKRLKRKLKIIPTKGKAKPTDPDYQDYQQKLRSSMESINKS